MKATETNFVEFLRKSPQFVIPIYQRTYKLDRTRGLHVMGLVRQAFEKQMGNGKATA